MGEREGWDKQRVDVLLVGGTEAGRVGEQRLEGGDDGRGGGVVGRGREHGLERLERVPHREAERVLVGAAVDAAHRLCHRRELLGDVWDNNPQ